MPKIRPGFLPFHYESLLSKVYRRGTRDSLSLVYVSLCVPVEQGLPQGYKGPIVICLALKNRFHTAGCIQFIGDPMYSSDGALTLQYVVKACGHKTANEESLAFTEKLN